MAMGDPNDFADPSKWQISGVKEAAEASGMRGPVFLGAGVPPVPILDAVKEADRKRRGGQYDYLLHEMVISAMGECGSWAKCNADVRREQRAAILRACREMTEDLIGDSEKSTGC